MAKDRMLWMTSAKQGLVRIFMAQLGGMHNIGDGMLKTDDDKGGGGSLGKAKSRMGGWQRM